MQNRKPRSLSVPANISDDGRQSIKVAIRIKPLKSPNITPSWITEPSKPNTLISNSSSSSKNDHFTYDNIFTDQSSTEYVYEGVGREIVRSCVMDGVNGTVFAYGQTCSGKTYTMQGDGCGDGITQLAAKDIFHFVTSDVQKRDFLIRVSFLEIYNEKIHDLLTTQKEQMASLPIRECPKRGIVVNCTEMVVTDANCVMRLLKAGERNRCVAGTAANERSSRSHAIFRIMVESRDGGRVLVSSLNLVDLAGSESVKYTGATGVRQREGGKINQSLLTLSQVITSLSSSPRTYVPFRNSKLTRVLQSSLSGHARMVLIACICPSPQFAEETRSTLKFASRAKLVTTKAEANVVLDDKALITKLQHDIEEMSKELQKRETKELEEKLQRLKSMILRAGFDRPEERGRRSRIGERDAGGGSQRLGRRTRSPPARSPTEVVRLPLHSELSTSQKEIMVSGQGSHADNGNSRSSIHRYATDVKTIVGDLHTSLNEMDSSSRRLIIDDDVDDNATAFSEISATTVLFNKSTEVDILKDALIAKNKKMRCLEVKCDKTNLFVSELQRQMDDLSMTVAWLSNRNRNLEQRVGTVLQENGVLKLENAKLKLELNRVDQGKGHDDRLVMVRRNYACFWSFLNWNGLFNFWKKDAIHNVYEPAPDDDSTSSTSSRWRRAFSWKRRGSEL
mmetsp:Transcript_63447/g.75084  ORF Transcript_63447/g.75084 Transcript_63447/m.75084 type:complete len:678 (+) Transcript_63447:173-2206(+)|eukprot:CAMPEP_0172498784 /NCGR_PEP_ID=MMETSP1066-20121228/117316_1 /TAXON_ID=671091 /ORGANISM="Coscinodiscus wailesii, Strain CCMP2513" /LENGTH=677 /DNA_ID=CAMNT_0013272211 /DNA_START=169 /DNA_END=2202 /DNA_ORIENTATION=-